MRKLFIALIIIGAVLLAAAAVFVFWGYPEKVRPLKVYGNAVKLYEAGDFVAAALQFESMGDFRDAPAFAKRAWIAAGDAGFESGDLAQARTYYLKGGADHSVYDKLDSAYYEKGVNAYAAGERVEAENCFSCISRGSRYQELLDPVRLSCAERFMNEGDLDSAEKVMAHCGGSAAEEIAKLWMECGRARLDTLDLDGASYCFAKAMAFAPDADAMLKSVNQIWQDMGRRAAARGDQALADQCYARIHGN